MMSVKVAVVGTGKISEIMMKESFHCDAFETVAVVSRSIETAKSFADRYSLKSVYHDIDSVIADKNIDAVYIATPNSTHCKYTIELLRGGKHVLCEKPIASDSGEAEEMYTVAKQNNKVLLEAMRTAYRSGLNTLKNLIEEWGRPVHAILKGCQYSSRYDTFKRGRYTNTFNPQLSNAAVMDLGVYCIRLMLELFGKPNKVMSSGTTLKNGFEAGGSIIAEYGDMTAELIYSKVSNSYSPSEIQFEKGGVLIGDIMGLHDISIFNSMGEIVTVDDENLDYVPVMKRFCELISSAGDFDRERELTIETMRIIDEVRSQRDIYF